VLGLVLLGLAGWLLTRRKPPAMPAPETLARQALEPLRRQPEDGVVLSRVSRILRRYLVAAFGLPAEELTRAEFCAALRQNQAIGGDLSAGVEQFLRRCDERKFAPQAPQPPLGAVDQALAFVEAARRRLMADSNPKSEPPLPSSNAPAANREL
jgi:hypothetical protein